MKKYILFIFFILPICLPAQTDSYTIGSRQVIAADSAALHEIIAAVASGSTATSASIEYPVPIALLADIVLDTPLIIPDGVHISLIASGGDRTLKRSASLIEYPVIWITGENSSLTLGDPDMAYELIIDGGYLNDVSIKAHAPLIAVNGLDSKLIMLDKVTLQNNYNNGRALTSSHHQNGAGVFIRTYNKALSTTEDNADRQAEFIMKGGIIRGNVNNVQSYAASGGGVLIAGFGIFTMEGGIIMNNTAQVNGGGFHTQGYGTFKKTGGIISGANAPVGFRNTAIEGYSEHLSYGHAVSVSAHYDIILRYRNNTAGEKDNLSYFGTPNGNGVFGKGEKWEYPSVNLLPVLLIIIFLVLALGVSVFMVWRRILKKGDTVSFADPDNYDLSPREKEILDLLLTSLSIKQIAYKLELTVSGVKFHAQNLYRKFKVQNRTELLVRLGVKKQ
ncbi:MAG: LuxR C-terminal-related transcriptional regulator [Treponema sp.]|nr:LuxR C-terminal-related transcriptional regulator [Treponema sp.]